MSFYSQEELSVIGFKALGQGVQVSRKASIHNPSKIIIGDYSRIDDYCVLSAGEGGIVIGRYVHLAIFASIMGAAKIEMQDYSGLSSRSIIYSSNDDYSGDFMTNPTIPTEFTNVKHASVTVSRHVVIGAGSIILPGVTLHEGAAVGALSLVMKDCKPYGIYFGSPAHFVGMRSKGMIEQEKLLIIRETKVKR